MYVKTFSMMYKIPTKGLMNLNLRVGGIRGASGSCFGQSLCCEVVGYFPGFPAPPPNISRWLQKPIHYREGLIGGNGAS